MGYTRKQIDNFISLMNSCDIDGMNAAIRSRSNVYSLPTYFAYAVEHKLGIDVIQWFLKQNINVNHVDATGMSATMHAAKNGYIDALKLLIQAGADLNLKDIYGRNAIMYATHSKHQHIVQLLAISGANYVTQVVEQYAHKGLFWCCKTILINKDGSSVSYWYIGSEPPPNLKLSKIRKLCFGILMIFCLPVLLLCLPFIKEEGYVKIYTRDAEETKKILSSLKHSFIVHDMPYIERGCIIQWNAEQLAKINPGSFNPISNNCVLNSEMLLRSGHISCGNHNIPRIEYRRQVIEAKRRQKLPTKSDHSHSSNVYYFNRSKGVYTIC